MSRMQMSLDTGAVLGSRWLFVELRWGQVLQDETSRLLQASHYYTLRTRQG